MPSEAWAMAKSGSISTARRVQRQGRRGPGGEEICCAVVYAFSASGDLVVASASAVECRWTEATDSPMRVLKRVAMRLRASSAGGRPCLGLPLEHHVAGVARLGRQRQDISLSRVAIEPLSTTVFPLRWQRNPLRPQASRGIHRPAPSTAGVP